jgi:hypothetical protein
VVFADGIFDRVSTGLENPRKSLNWKKISQDWKVLENQ